MRIKVFTHNDLDGVGCAVICKTVYEGRTNTKVDVTFCNYHNASSMISEFIDNNIKDYDYLYVTDLCLPQETIDQLIPHAAKTLFVDHHISGKEIADKIKAPWYVLNEDVSQCATSTLYTMMRPLIKANPEMDRFVDLVRQYDTWSWTESWNLDAVALNKATGFYDLEKQSNIILSSINNAQLNRYIKSFNARSYFQKLEESIANEIHEVGEFAVGLDITDVGLMAEIMRHNGSQLKALIDIVPSKLRASIRSIDPEFDCTEYAAQFDGGGHKAAAGWQYDKELSKKIVMFAFEQFNKPMKKKKSSVAEPEAKIEVKEGSDPADPS